MMTDHGQFILVNVYGVAVCRMDTEKKRKAFRERFLEARSAPTCVPAASLPRACPA
jgi:hypothetical protein